MGLQLPFLLEPSELESYLNHPDLLIIDIGDLDSFEKERIPTAVHVDYLDIVSGEVPASGTLPSTEQLVAVFSSIGLRRDQHVVAYDSEWNGRAARLLWTLDVLAHPNLSLLNGGYTSWKHEKYPVETTTPREVTPSNYQAYINGKSHADKHYILSKLENPRVGILDARSPLEFEGFDVRALRGGHIPGAKNINWLDTIDTTRNNRFKSSEQLRDMLRQQGLTPDKEIITYCQTHHRSSHSYAMLKALGYERIRGYAGSWSEWGNSLETPVEQTMPK